jgi:hypothetical protein
MMQHRRRSTVLGLILGSLSAVLVFALQARATDTDDAVTEEFHQTYALAATGRIELENINGPVHITAWDRNDVKVDAIKRAWSKDRLQEAKIEVDSSPDSLSIRTEYPRSRPHFLERPSPRPAGKCGIHPLGATQRSPR